MKRHAPATARNTAPIARVLAKELPESGSVLEIASGSGEHAIAFARKFPDLVWQPSDPDPDALASIRAWIDEAVLGNILPPIGLDASEAWPNVTCDAILCCNMVHISRWTATVGLMSGAAACLPKNGPLILYGPYLEDGVPTARSNLDFDQSLKARNPDWGIRQLADVDALAADYGLVRTARYEMPANNLLLVYRR